MRTTKTTAMALAAAACMLPGYAWAESTPAQGPALTGLWKLVSYEVEVRSSGEKDPVMGSHPTGYAYFTPEGRVFFLLTGEGRTPAKDDAHRAHLLETLVSYTGKVTFKDDQWTAKLDTAWDPKWVGTEQVRTFKKKGNQLQVLTPWRVMPNWASQGETRSIVTFEQAKD